MRPTRQLTTTDAAGVARLITVVMTLSSCSVHLEGTFSGASGEGAGGEDSSGTTSGTGTGGSTGQTSTSASVGAGPTTSVQAAASVQVSAGQGGSSGDGGAAPASGAAGAAGGGGVIDDAPCAAECAGDPGCDVEPNVPSGPCQSCVDAEMSRGVESECGVEAALGACCQDDGPCRDHVDCLLGGGEDCAVEHEAGAERLRRCGLASCGGCEPPS